jgi:hypothetical protein
VTPEELVAQLNDPNRLVRTGVVLLPPDQIPSYRTLATRWGASAIDLAEIRLEHAPAGSRYLAISADSVVADLDSIATSTFDRHTVVVANLDLLLARLDERSRSDVWTFLLFSFRRRSTGLLLLMPAEADHLFPPVEVQRWAEAGRLCRFFDMHSATGATSSLWEA